MRTVVRNSFARQSMLAECVYDDLRRGCTECGQLRTTPAGRSWLYRYHVDDDSRHSGPMADGRLFCCRSCAEAWLSQAFNETGRH